MTKAMEQLTALDQHDAPEVGLFRDEGAGSSRMSPWLSEALNDLRIADGLAPVRSALAWDFAVRVLPLFLEDHPHREEILTIVRAGRTLPTGSVWRDQMAEQIRG